MEVILFYVMIIGGFALAATTYLGLLALPVGLALRLFGIPAAIAYAALLVVTFYRVYQPPYDGMSMDFVPQGMRQVMNVMKHFQDPPIASLLAAAALSLAALLVLLLAWLARRVAT
ncbi:MAG TPA: hypothetical protein VMF90_17535 [Rhizobiaceae bacterium]|nr:hypothetical protein [Rhizobiaceae bacterium]